MRELDPNTEFNGAKLALFLGGSLVVIQRDNIATIPHPGRWDFPGGGREGGERPAQCALRETREELGLSLEITDLVYARSYERPKGTVWLFAAHLHEELERDICFGEEGQGWALMEPKTYMSHPLGISSLQSRLGQYLEVRAGVATR